MKFSYLFLASSSILLAACGGGGGDSTGSTQGSTTTSNTPAPDTPTPSTAPTVTATQAAISAPAASRWTFAASENAAFTVAGGSMVRYGTGSTWIERSHTGAAVCSNAWFGSDPVPGQLKQCETLAGAATTSSSSSGGDWSWVAAETGTFTINGSSNVRYGVDGAWAERTISGGAQCSTSTFGWDPAPGQIKRCEVQGSAVAAAPTAPTAFTTAPAAPAAPSSTWSSVAGENQAFTVNGSGVIRYGAGSAWAERTISGAAVCSNGTFGWDPAPGVVKHCEVQGSTPVIAQAPTQAPAPTTAPAPAPAPAPAVAATLGNPLGSARIMISGHSLTDDPLGDYMSSIASSLGTPMWWNEQIGIGSTLRARTSGGNESDPTFPGYRTGKNRNGSSGLNIVSEFLYPQTLGGERYDTLLMTERHDIASTLVWEDTVRFARHYHDRLVAGNANANSYLYHAWQGVNDKSNPGSWINYERTVAPAWQCTAARVNESLAGVGRSDRMAYLPAGLALANLVEQSVYGYVAGISGGSAWETMSRLFTDDVHMTSTGMYYMALVSYASVYRRSPVGAWAPADVSAQAAASLQQIAWQSVANHYNSANTPSMPQCQSLMRDQICAAFANYKNLPNSLNSCLAKFSSQSQDNPFYYNAGSDAGYWLAAPP